MTNQTSEEEKVELLIHYRWRTDATACDLV